MKKNEISSIGLILRGMCMGIAEVIPGVSGGTIALITNIYYQLLTAIKSITGIIAEPKILLSPKKLWNRIDGPFLLFVFSGMAIGILVGIFGVTYFLENYPEPLWSFFFGLILASIIYLIIENKPIDIMSLIMIVIGTVIAFGIVQLTPAQGAASLPFIFIAGMIAICALILPGISGSFMLLLMGLYSVVMPAVKDVISFQDLSKIPLVITFALGCLLGISLFSRVLHWLLVKHQRPTMALLIGFMIGSLYKLWPWRNPVSVMDKETSQIIHWDMAQFDPSKLHDMRILAEHNVLPSEYWGQGLVIPVVVSFFLGLGVVWIMAKLGTES